ncbi:gamma-glutamylcyclotransferase family protein [Lihuaxuella thermophila]|uniref:Gamma-glutamylcyclotransferase family protein n=1 Tax=Lihuaxuella thermophila TaxID=1173111 RepID=A0A1H8D052_9BACL|nr:gamma-glutamylcyclotransferase [Lihuaxuella thermophila]SEN00625.1 gamma-L-glutamyl-butirosin B gamma-L-glutamyl cyclotransferase [Lihuaxuella thermophila]
MNLFVYGTLRRGMSNAGYLRDAKLIAAKAWTEGKLYDTRRGYPGLVPGQGTVYGEIYRIHRMQIKQVDDLEDYYGPGHPQNMYERKLKRVATDHGFVWAYLYYYCDQEKLMKTGIWIPGGDWCSYAGKKKG